VLTTTPASVDLLAELGYDPDMGARPLKRVIQQKVEDPLSDALLSGRFDDGDTVVVDVEEGEIILRRGETETEAPPSEPVTSA
jgi:ATP-dependent Clp protease ATP-binding subunit ClpA